MNLRAYSINKNCILSMEIIDIVVPYNRSRIRKLPLFKSSLFDVIANSDWYPLFINRNNFYDYGFKFRFFTPKNLPFDHVSNCVIIDSRIKDGTNIKWSDVKSLIRKYKKEGRKVILFDSKDSPNLVMDLLPEVDYYMKKQLLKNRSLYEYGLIGGRLFTDYYSQIIKGNPWESQKYQPSEYKNIFIENEHKLMLSWNILMAIDKFNSIKDYLRFISIKSVNLSYTKPEIKREVKLNANFSTSYTNELVSLQRIYLNKFLNDFKLVSGNSCGIVPKSIYIENLKRSNAIVSPFGWGEICYRDFEAFIYGSALIKPNMDHLDTWPNLYKPNKTYIPISWNSDKWENEFQEILNDEKLMLNVAELGQNSFRKLWGIEGQEYFCKRLSSKLNYMINN